MPTQKTPGRPKNSPNCFAPKNSIRSRTFSVVIHDVLPGSKAKLNEKINDVQPDWSLIAEEPYNHQDGSHIHLFIKYNQPKAKAKILSFIQRLELGGRVQVDIGRGTFDECQKYIINPDKIKSLDTAIIKNVVRLTSIEKHPDQVSVCSHCGVKYWDPPDDFGASTKCCGRLTCHIECHKKK
ncbi:MAG: putative replicase [Cressdnaviricota sp.]|nr:MAG: putative replicase [Cressdnaviricota sp.]